jgi:hypothetical protein
VRHSPGRLFAELRFRSRRFTFIHPYARALRRAADRLRIAILNLLRRLPAPISLGLARGFYSDLDLLQANPPQVKGRIVLLDQGTIAAAPDSMLELSGRQQHKVQPWPVFWALHHEAELIGPSLAHVDAGNRLCLEAVYQRWAHDDPSNLYPRGWGRPTRLAGNWTSIVSRWMPTSHPDAYAHWIFDALPRLALIDEFPPDTRIIVAPFRLPYQQESLRLLGLLDRCRWSPERHLVVENYYFSTPTTMICCYNPYGIRWMRETFVPLVQADPRPIPRRFFVRRKGDRRNIVNEAEVLDFFRGIGWEVVDAGDLTFAEQIRYFSQAEAICGIHGSGFLNMMWCPPGVRLLELFADSFLGSEAEWMSTCIPDAIYRRLIFPSDYNISAIVDLNRVRESLRQLDLPS